MTTPPREPYRLLILSRDAGEYARRIRTARPPHLDVAAAVGDDPQAVARCDILLGEPERIAAVLPEAGRLRWVQSAFAGVEPLMAPGLRRDYVLTGVKDVFGPLMSAYVFAHLLARERRLGEYAAQQRRREWRPLPCRRLGRLRMGLCGTGSIGTRIAATARHFGMRVWGLRRTAAPLDGYDRIFGPPALATFLAGCDYVVVTLPDTPETRGLIDARALAAMRPDAVLISVGRGTVIDESALADALAAGRIAGAVLDVFRREPLPPESPLWGLPGVVLTPHVSAVSYADEISRIFLDNYMRFRSGAELQGRVDFGRGY